MKDTDDGHWLHIYAQEHWHDDVFIVGNKRALRELGEALIRAADGGKLEISGGMVSDGEGYTIAVVPMTAEQMHCDPESKTGKIEDTRVVSQGVFWELAKPYTDHELCGLPKPPWPSELIDRERYEALHVNGGSDGQVQQTSG